MSASLITGEERRIVEGSRVTASTIEMLDPTREIDVAVIDEIQMLSDPDRGCWTRRWWAPTPGRSGCSAPCRRSRRSRPWRPGLACRWRSATRRASTPVVGHALANNPAGALRKARRGDAFIVFSRRDALNLRDDLLALGKPVACIYGALSPEVREREARRFAGGDADILVATDAIGMGLNLPIQRWCSPPSTSTTASNGPSSPRRSSRSAAGQGASGTRTRRASWPALPPPSTALSRP